MQDNKDRRVIDAVRDIKVSSVGNFFVGIWRVLILCLCVVFVILAWQLGVANSIQAASNLAETEASFTKEELAMTYDEMRDRLNAQDLSPTQKATIAKVVKEDAAERAYYNKVTKKTGFDTWSTMPLYNEAFVRERVENEREAEINQTLRIWRNTPSYVSNVRSDLMESVLIFFIGMAGLFICVCELKYRFTGKFFRSLFK